MGFLHFLPSNPGYYRFQVSHHLCDPSSHEPQGEELEPEVPDKARWPRGAPSGIPSLSETKSHTRWCPSSLAKLVYNSNNYGFG